MLYSCEKSDDGNQDQLDLVKKTCQSEEACRIDASRDFFGDDECPGTEDGEMALWLMYSCVGGTDRTETKAPKCDDTEPPSGPPSPSGPPTSPGGKQKQLDVRGCGGWIYLDCSGGSLKIYKVWHGPWELVKRELIKKEENDSQIAVGLPPPKMELFPHNIIPMCMKQILHLRLTLCLSETIELPKQEPESSDFVCFPFY